VRRRSASGDLPEASEMPNKSGGRKSAGGRGNIKFHKNWTHPTKNLDIGIGLTFDTGRGTLKNCWLVPKV
jgi:hypothetical protein